MRKINLRTLVIYALAGLSGIMLLYTSQNVQRAEDRLAAIEASAENEIESIRVLKAEWAYLNSPARLEMLAQEFLSLDAPDPSHIISEPSFLPMPVTLEQDDVLYREVSTAQEREPVSVPAPLQKPVPPVRSQPKSNKSFGALLDELGDEGSVP